MTRPDWFGNGFCRYGHDIYLRGVCRWGHQKEESVALPKEAKDRKAVPITTGVLDYFPDALAEVARVSLQGNEQHNPGEPLHWARGKSTDQADCIVRHLLERGTFDTDGMRHSAKVAWRALALLQLEIEADEPSPPSEDDAAPNWSDKLTQIGTAQEEWEKSHPRRQYTAYPGTVTQ